MFLIVVDLVFQMQEKSRRSISKKVRNARFLIMYYQQHWYLGDANH